MGHDAYFIRLPCRKTRVLPIENYAGQRPVTPRHCSRLHGPAPRNQPRWGGRAPRGRLKQDGAWVIGDAGTTTWTDPFGVAAAA